MEPNIGVEKARGKLGELLDQVARSGEPVMLSKRGQTLGVLLSREEYSRMKEASTRIARAELAERLAKARRQIKSAGLDPTVVDEAIAAARKIS